MPPIDTDPHGLLALQSIRQRDQVLHELRDVGAGGSLLRIALATKVGHDAAIGRGVGVQIFLEGVAGGHQALDVDYRVAGPCFNNTQRHSIQ